MADEVTVQRISVTPNNCLLEEPITLEMDFTAPRELPDGTWRMRVRHRRPQITFILQPTTLTALPPSSARSLSLTLLGHAKSSVRGPALRRWSLYLGR